MKRYWTMSSLKRHENNAASAYNASTGFFDMLIPTFGSSALIAHELKHGYQFETGSLSTDMGKYPVFYDKSPQEQNKMFSKFAKTAQSTFRVNGIKYVGFKKTQYHETGYLNCICNNVDVRMCNFIGVRKKRHSQV